ncbi:hypothetical protein [Protaetiibacter intestinalis]|uniref:Uncharacterized protein n=1 Tax=Protaetiibacter intestinalis TaxID=2419774 RepID=A0A387B7X9_9MICO|nr:hypothetical protein [Protaetiibacter intestinalis]AYF97206.1 hypothetical protein D7I47_02370 [Protaetiibacter intestinalis]
MTGERKSGWKVLVAGILVVAGVTTAAQPASADTTTSISGYQQDNFFVQYWSTARTNTHAKNVMYLKLTSVGGCGCGIAFASRPGLSASTNARISGYISAGAWHEFHADNGNAWLSAGTFYLSSAVGGNYVNDYDTWSGSLWYDVLYY